MKALDYLYRMKKANDEMGMGAQNIDEAIAELEALQQPKQCNTCRFYHSFTGVCANDNCPLCADFVDAGFGCIYHEAKGAMR
ncbi:MAG: hypothetical protein PHH29_17095 [Desulfuromonadaceae bacterium]|nr:hypothetical protein [Desulfuromonadaceae bacterium]